MQTIQKTYKYGIDIVEVQQDRELDEESRLCDLRCGALPIKKEKDEVDDYDVAIYIEQMKERCESGGSMKTTRIRHADSL